MALVAGATVSASGSRLLQRVRPCVLWHGKAVRGPALAFGAAGAKGGAVIGSFFGPGPSTAIGAGIGGITGAILGEKAADNVYLATVDEDHSDEHVQQKSNASGHCDDVFRVR